MNTVEDRLRDALRAHAENFSAHPDAWERTVARSRRRPGRAPRWTRFMIPAAAAAAVVAIVVGATVLTGHGGSRGGSVGGVSASATPSPSGAPAPPGPGDYLIRSVPPSSAIVPVKLTAGQQTTWTFVWFGRMKSDPGEGVQLCSETGGTGGCAPPALQAQQGFVEGTGTVKLIVSDRQVTSITALLPAGRRVSGVAGWGRGFPEKVWLVDYPSQDHATIVLRNAAGQVLSRLSIAAEYPTPSQPRSGGIKLFSYPAGSIAPTPGTMTAYLLDGRLIGVNGRVVGFWGSDSSSVISSVPVSGPQAVVNVGGSWLRGAKVVEFYGYAHSNVARVALRLTDGRQYGAPTSAAWPGSGLRLWHFSVPIKAATFAPGHQVLLGYDNAGRVVWQNSLREPG